MKNKVTVQDIADALSLSRITVSKALNNSPNVSAETRELVLQKAREMNYKYANFAMYTAKEQAPAQPKSFAFVMQMNPDAFHIGSQIMVQLEQEIRKKGYSLTIHTITKSDIDAMALPQNLAREQVEAIICLEMFHPEYSRLICSLGKPVLFIDACADFYSLNLQCDLLLMENRSSVSQMLISLCTRHQIGTMGFVGDCGHCLSFRERYEGLLLAANACKAVTEPYHIIADDSFYSQAGWIKKQLEDMKELPKLFFCANDVLAMILIENLLLLGYRIPDDVLVCGFDGLPSISPIINSLTTVRTPCKELGNYAAHLLFSRIQDPARIPSSTYLGTQICFRETAP